MISVNVANLLKDEKAVTQELWEKNNLTKSHLVNIITDATAGRQTVSVNEVSKILQAQATFYNSTIDVVRKQLVTLAAVLSNLAEGVQRQKKQIDTVAKWIVQLAETSLPDSPKPGEPAKDLPAIKLPQVLVEQVAKQEEWHRCKCLSCDPEHYEKMIEDNLRRARVEWLEGLTDTTMEAMRKEVADRTLRFASAYDHARICYSLH